MTPEHRAARAGRMTGTRIPMALGVSPYGGPAECFLDMQGRLPEDNRNATGKMMGNMLEDVVALLYQEETSRLVLHPSQPFDLHPRVPLFACSRDRESYGESTTRTLECKTARQRTTTHSNGQVETWGDAGTDAIPRHYLVQTQWQLYVRDEAQLDVAVLIGGHDFQVHPVFRQDELIGLMVDAALEMLRRVELNDPPAVDWMSRRAKEVHDILFRPLPWVSIDLSPELIGPALRYVKAGKLMGQLEKAKERDRAILLDAMGDAAVAMLPDGTVIKRTLRQVKAETKLRDGYESIVLNVKPPLAKEIEQ